MNIAIIGGGIGGLFTAYYLNKNNQITVFESSDYFVGHAHTISVEVQAKTYWIDLGFAVYK
jgi:predicted NAD/FAD-binding protein